MSADAPAPDRPKYEGGGRAIAILGGAGGAGLLLTALRGLADVHVALASYLTAFAYWLGIALGALLLLLIWHASKARWAVVVRRLVEVMAAPLVLFPLLFLPIALGLHTLYPWAGPAAALDEESRALVHHRAVYLNPTFFFTRAVFYFVVWIVVSRLLLAWSTRQDESGEAALTRRAWVLGPAALPVVGLTLTFAAIDWVMSLGTKWVSSMWGVYYFSGSFLGALALLVLLVVMLERSPAFAGAVKTAHLLSLGKFLLAFTCFWGYIAFSQYMLTWVANLPDAIPWLIRRQSNGWGWIGLALIVGHFVLPFFLLLSRRRKMNPRVIAAIAIWLLSIHYVDLYWMVMPEARPTEIVPDWSNLTALVGVGGVSLAWSVATLRGRRAIPVGDPFLEDSLHYAKMM
jgi:hypothetical protein